MLPPMLGPRGCLQCVASDKFAHSLRSLASLRSLRSLRSPHYRYDEHEHIGYDVTGKKIIRQTRVDGLDRYLASQDDPNYGRTVYDERTGRDVVLSDRQINVVRRMLRGQYAHPEFEAYPDYIDYNTWKPEIHAIGNDYRPKSHFTPSKWEQQAVMKIVKGIKDGTIQLRKDRTPKSKEEPVYLLWGEDDTTGENAAKGPPRMQAPKVAPPGHAESYNPPVEYLLNDEERKAWEEADPEERDTNFMPQNFGSLRKVPAYQNFVKERFERALDLYLCPRTIKKRLNIDPESLVPKLPSPEELRPYPTTIALEYEGHAGRVRSLSVSVCGQWLLTGADDGTVRLWEVQSGRQQRQWTIDVSADPAAEGGDPLLKQVVQVAFSPTTPAVASCIVGSKLLLLATEQGDADQQAAALDLLAYREPEAAGADEDSKDKEVDEADSAAKKKAAPVAHWLALGGEAVCSANAASMPGSRGGFCIEHVTESAMKQLAWHRKGDYVASVAPTSGSGSGICIHQVRLGTLCV